MFFIRNIWKLEVPKDRLCQLIDMMDADEDGYVWYPNVDIVTEMTNMIDSTRAYEANATAFTASKSMAMKGLNIGQT